MLVHDLFFWLAVFFLVGVFFASIFNLAGSLTAVALIAVIFLTFDKKILAAISLISIIGAGYYFIFDYYQNKSPLRPEGIVTKAEQHLNYQELILDNRLKIITAREPAYHYGDYLKANGEIKKSRSKLLRGLISYPKIELIAENQGNSIKMALIKIRLGFEKNLKKVLPIEKSAFLSGLTVGSTAEFSEELKEKMLASGTTHLTALSGSNISIITENLFWLIGFWPTVLLIIAFVIMTGAESSLVRAAFMSIVALLAPRLQRFYYPRNAITAAALAMIFLDPKILTFDLGFQLSFLAITGITYLQPYLEKKTLPWTRDKPAGIQSFLHHYFWPTIAAQAAVLPLIILKFSRFNPLSIAASILIMPIIPQTMGLGFITGALGFISHLLSFPLALATNILLSYELAIVRLFAVGG